MFPFYNNYPGTDLHEIDLAYVLKLMAQYGSNISTVMSWKAAHEEEYAQLKNTVDGLVNNLVDVIVPWDSSIAYHIFTIVEYQGQNYIAIQDVPIGAMITNTDYWQPANTVIEQVNAIGAVVNSVKDSLAYFGDFLTPQMFGAKGDGVTDDTNAIDTLYNTYFNIQELTEESSLYRNAGNDVFVYFPRGVYLYNGEGITIPDRKHLRLAGEGQASSAIILGNDITFFTTANYVYSAEISDITFTGGKSVFTMTDNQKDNIFDNIYIHDCTFKDYTGCAIGSERRDQPNLIIKRCKFWGDYSTGIGIATPADCAGLLIESCEFISDAVHLKMCDGGRNATLIDNAFVRESTTRNNGVISVWILPCNPSGGINSNYDHGLHCNFIANKFGGESMIADDIHILIANETGNYLESVTPDYTNMAGHVIGLRLDESNFVYNLTSTSDHNSVVTLGIYHLAQCLIAPAVRTNYNAPDYIVKASQQVLAAFLTAPETARRDYFTNIIKLYNRNPAVNTTKTTNAPWLEKIDANKIGKYAPDSTVYTSDPGGSNITVNASGAQTAVPTAGTYNITFTAGTSGYVQLSPASAATLTGNAKGIYEIDIKSDTVEKVRVDILAADNVVVMTRIINLSSDFTRHRFAIQGTGSVYRMRIRNLVNGTSAGGVITIKNAVCYINDGVAVSANTF